MKSRKKMKKVELVLEETVVEAVKVVEAAVVVRASSQSVTKKTKRKKLKSPKVALPVAVVVNNVSEAAQESEISDAEEPSLPTPIIVSRSRNGLKKRVSGAIPPNFTRGAFSNTEKKMVEDAVVKYLERHDIPRQNISYLIHSRKKNNPYASDKTHSDFLNDVTPIRLIIDMSSIWCQSCKTANELVHEAGVH